MTTTEDLGRRWVAACERAGVNPYPYAIWRDTGGRVWGDVNRRGGPRRWRQPHRAGARRPTARCRRGWGRRRTCPSPTSPCTARGSAYAADRAARAPAWAAYAADSAAGAAAWAAAWAARAADRAAGAAKDAAADATLRLGVALLVAAHEGPRPWESRRVLDAVASLEAKAAEVSDGMPDVVR